MKRTAHKRILVIDDDHDIWKAYQLTLEPREEQTGSDLDQITTMLSSKDESCLNYGDNFHLSYAAQGQDGFHLVEEALDQGKPFSLVFVDIRMPPGWDGMETAKRIRKLDPDIEIVIVTAYSDRSCEEIVRAVGKPEKILFFRKPFDPEELKQLAISLTDKWHIGRREEAQRHKLETLVSTSPAAIYTVDASRTIRSWNPAAAEITGYSAEEVLFKPCIFTRISDSPDCLACSGKKNLHEYLDYRELHITSKDGKSKVLSMHMAHIPGANQCPARNIYSFWDISDLKRTERELAETNRELEDQIGERDRLQQEQQALARQLHQAQKMEAIGLMAGGVAHDLNNILSGIISYPEILMRRLPESSDMLKPLQTIKTSGLRAAAVVSDMLTVARGVAIVMETASLNSLIREYLESPEGEELQSLYPQVTIKTNLASDIANISCSPVHIKKCLMNLITNAAEAIDGEGEVTVSTSDKDGKDKQVLLNIADTGPGINDTDLEHIFEPFYSKKKMGRSGTGLGLAVVWNCVNNHNGQISVSSSRKGTIFTVLMPATSKQVQAAGVSLSIEAMRGRGTILVVDDEQQQRDIASNILQMFGYSVTTVASGEEAVAFMAEHTVDLLLLDMLMEPGINGYETYKRILKIRPGQKAILVSGFSESADVLKARELGASSFVKKPYTSEQLGVAIKAILQ